MAELTRRELLYAVGGASTGLVAGFASGMLALKRGLEKKFAQIAEEEIDEMRKHFQAKEALLDADPKPNLETLVKDRGYAAGSSPDETGDAGHRDPSNTLVFGEQEMTPEVAEIVAGGPPVIAKSIFDTPQPTNSELYPEWDYETETAKRSDDKPFVVHKDEFAENEDIAGQYTWTYFAGDSVLADERGVQIDNADEIVGLENLEKFGHGSGDADTVFVRNVRLRMDIEIVKSDGKHAHEVMGLDAEEKFDNAPSPFHRRGFDDDGSS